MTLEHQWTQLLGLATWDNAPSIAIASDGSIYLAGSTEGDLDEQIISGGGSDAFITKYSREGIKEWTQLLGSALWDQATSIAIASDGSIYLAGSTYGNLDEQINSGDYSDTFVTKYSSEGIKEWTQLLGLATWDNAPSITTVIDGFIYASGNTYYAPDGQSELGGIDAFIAKYAISSTSIVNLTDILCSSFDFDENISASSLVATFFSSSPDLSDIFTYSFVPGYADNAAFSISGDQLLINDSPDYEIQSSYSIRVQCHEQGGLLIEKEFTFSVNDINDAPSIGKLLSLEPINRDTNFSYTLPVNLFVDQDSILTLSATTSTGAPLPFWLSFDTSTGTFAGTPTTTGTVALNISASDGLTSVSTPFEFQIRDVQSISSSSKPIVFERNKDLTIPVNYSTTDGSKSTGISFGVYFDSTLLSFDVTTGITDKAQADLFEVGVIQEDVLDSDSDSRTDNFIPIFFKSFSGDFPSTAMSTVPTKLADLTFTVVDKSIDAITGLKSTIVNFTEIETAQGYGFRSNSAYLTPFAFNLDVDGDGKVTALGDGLMIIRKLFGSTFAGDALTNKAISPGATRNTTEIHEFIQQGIDSGLLDVDKDLRTTALGDGLMVIRKLFGATFYGSALTDKAISPDSSLLDGSNYSLMTTDQRFSLAGLIGANINALFPPSNVL